MPGRAVAVVLPAEESIRYGAEIQQTGFHPLDGGLHLRKEGWPDIVSGLLAVPLRRPLRSRGREPRCRAGSLHLPRDALADAGTITVTSIWTWLRNPTRATFQTRPRPSVSERHVTTRSGSVV